MSRRSYIKRAKIRRCRDIASGEYAARASRYLMVKAVRARWRLISMSLSDNETAIDGNGVSFGPRFFSPLELDRDGNPKIVGIVGVSAWGPSPDNQVSLSAQK